MAEIARLHYITQAVAGVSHAQLAQAACQGGVDWVQLRVKNKDEASWKSIALEVRKVCKQYGAKLIINDNPKLAFDIQADGVHLGKTDMPPQQARVLLGNNMIIGGTANTWQDIVQLHQAGVDYIGLGPFRFTQTKENLSPVLGVEGYQTLIQACKDAQLSLPIIAIGGIIEADLEILFETGFYGVAISSAINLAADRQASAGAFLAQINALVKPKKSVH